VLQQGLAATGVRLRSMMGRHAPPGTMELTPGADKVGTPNCDRAARWGAARALTIGSVTQGAANRPLWMIVS
jgi:hypothetical protein